MAFPAKLAKAKQLAVYFDNYVNYISTIDDQPSNVGNGTPKPPQTDLYIKPFGLDLATTQFLRVSATSDRWATYGSQFTGYAQDTINTGGGETFLRIKGVRPARLVIKQGLTQNGVAVTAKATKRKYLSYGGSSGSIAFGQNTTETEVEAYQTLKLAIETSGGFNELSMRVSRVKEVA